MMPTTIFFCRRKSRVFRFSLVTQFLTNRVTIVNVDSILLFAADSGTRTTALQPTWRALGVRGKSFPGRIFLCDVIIVISWII